MFANQQKNYVIPAVLWFTSFCGLISFLPTSIEARTKSSKFTKESVATFGTIRGNVRDQQGNAIAGALVAILKNGTSTVLKQIESASDGSFSTRIISGTYKILAVAEGFNPVVLSDVQVSRAIELNYGFKLERAGSGNTLPEKRVDRNSSKWRIRAAQIRRSIYQAQESQTNPEVAVQTDPKVDESIGVTGEDNSGRKNLRSQNLVETFVASSGKSTYSGLNFVTVQPVNENFELSFAGQIASSKKAPQRFEISTKTRIAEKHQLRINAAAATFGKVSANEESEQKELGQFSFQASDEWKVREGVILVLGVDFSKFVGAGNASSLTPRLGLLFDVNSKTRLSAAVTTSTEEKFWQKASGVGESEILFKELAPAENSIVFVDDKPQISKRQRMEIGIERVLDNKSNIEMTAFFDNVNSRGVGLTSLPVNLLSQNTDTFVASQNGTTQGIRAVYTRRLNGTFTATAGYAFGRGQKLSPKGLQTPSELFQSGIFQNAVFQLTADLNNGTRVKTIYRLSPSATVFAIDPFQGRLAIYDPSLSVLITQSLPNFGFPVHAEATVDARNLFDFGIGIGNQQSKLKLSNGTRVLRGGISLRF